MEMPKVAEMTKPTAELMEEHRVIERMLAMLSKASDKLERGEEVDPSFFADAADFLKNFADRCHHGKEESLLFEKMQERGVSGEVGPIAVMMREHDDGRAHVRKMDGLSKERMTDKSRAALLKASRAYVNLLSMHIQKEDNVLYPLADQILTPEDDEELEKGFEKVEEEIMGHGLHDRYLKMIQDWEERLA